MTESAASEFCLPMPRHGESEFAQDTGLRLGAHIKQCEQMLMAAKTQALRPYGLTVAQYAVLMSLFYVPGQSSAQLARAADVTPQTMGTVLTKLAKRRLIDRVPSKLHRKVFEISLTKEGKALIVRADSGPRGIEEELGNAFSAEDRDRLRDLLSRATAILRDTAST